MTHLTTAHASPEGRNLVFALPADVPSPQYQWGQQVLVPSRHTPARSGIIRGLEYFTPRLSQAIDHTLDWVGWNYTLEVVTTQGLSIMTVTEREIEPCTT
jgi:hypothetical protein